jgi:hypothetical protein
MTAVEHMARIAGTDDDTRWKLVEHTFKDGQSRGTLFFDADGRPDYLCTWQPPERLSAVAATVADGAGTDALLIAVCRAAPTPGIPEILQQAGYAVQYAEHARLAHYAITVFAEQERIWPNYDEGTQACDPTWGDVLTVLSRKYGKGRGRRQRIASLPFQTTLWNEFHLALRGERA